MVPGRCRGRSAAVAGSPSGSSAVVLQSLGNGRQCRVLLEWQCAFVESPL